MSAAVKNEAFMTPAPPNEAAQRWLQDTVSIKDAGTGWMRALRETGHDAFSVSGLPTPSAEGWQYTNLRLLTSKNFTYSPAPVRFDSAKIPQPLLKDSGRVVIVNGQYHPQLSRIPAGVEVMSLLDAADKKMEGLEHYMVSVGDLGGQPFKALNTAYTRDGIVIRVAAKQVVTQPIEILYYNIGSDAQAPATYPRALYWLQQGAEATLIERHEGEGAYFVNAQVEIGLESSAVLKHYRFMCESASAVHFSLTSVQQQKSSHFEGFSMASGAALARQEYQLKLIDSVISSSIAGTYLLKNQQTHDFTVLADHFEPNGTSVQCFKGVIDDQARSVFQGKIQVRRTAQGTNGYQSHHALLLSDQAEASVKPELEIYADDVKCSHGAANGQLDPAALFYLQSRGIPEEEARALLVESFLNGAVEKVSYEPVRDLYRASIRDWLAAKGQKA